MRVTGVLCLGGVTIRSRGVRMAREGLEVRPGRELGQISSCVACAGAATTPAKSLKELHRPEQQEANTRRAVRQAVLADQHKQAVTADRVVNIDETSCRLLPVHQIGWGRRGVKQAQLQGIHKGGLHDTSRSRFAGHAGADRARWQGRRRLAGAALAGAHSSTSRQRTAGPTTTTILQLAAALDNVLNASR